MKDEAAGQGALICIPTYNERENIAELVGAVRREAPAADILIVDDSSPDGTGGIADCMAAEDEQVRVLHRDRKEGLGKAYLSAFKWGLDAGYQVIVEFDADFSHDPKYLPQIFSLLKEADVVVGSRRVRGGGVRNWGIHRRFLSWGGSLYARVTLGVSVKDLTGGLNAFRREVLEAIEYETIRSTGYAFQIEIKYRCIQRGFRITEMPIIFPDRARGESKMSAKIMGEAMAQVLRLRFRK
jgi:dolichol-phosphate mannosyltransferase